MGATATAVPRSGSPAIDVGVILKLARLDGLVERTAGRADVVVGVVDGPVARHPGLSEANIVDAGTRGAACGFPAGAACLHGTFVMGMLAGQRGGDAPALCPGCSFVVSPLFAESASEFPVATPAALRDAIVSSVDAGARIVNLSASTGTPSPNEERELKDALDYALRRGTVVVAAAGNQGLLGSSAITRHAVVLPVAACDLNGRPLPQSNLGRAVGLRGLLAPGSNVVSLGAEGTPLTWSGTSVAAPFVTGALALLCSLLPRISPMQARLALTGGPRRRASVVPPLLDAWGAYQRLEVARR